MNLLRICSMAVLCAAWAGAGYVAQAAPAPWYWWANKHDGQRVCAQFMPEQGWVRAQGPFNNSQCRPQGAWVPRRGG